jgi:hypothetical protein
MQCCSCSLRVFPRRAAQTFHRSRLVNDHLRHLIYDQTRQTAFKCKRSRGRDGIPVSCNLNSEAGHTALITLDIAFTVNRYEEPRFSCVSGRKPKYCAWHSITRVKKTAHSPHSNPGPKYCRCNLNAQSIISPAWFPGRKMRLAAWSTERELRDSCGRCP